MRNTYIILLGILYLTGCSNPYETQIIGDWTATKITEEGEELNVDAQEVQLSLKTNGDYSYNSTLKYKEAGSWFLDENLLFTNDTVHKAGQKAVMILSVQEDTLVIKMEEKGKERLLTLTK